MTKAVDVGLFGVCGAKKGDYNYVNGNWGGIVKTVKARAEIYISRRLYFLTVCVVRSRSWDHSCRDKKIFLDFFSSIEFLFKIVKNLLH